MDKKMNHPEIRNWSLAFLLTSPMLIFFGGYLFNHSGDLIPTGFIQYDNVSYIAYAKQYLDSNVFHWQYSNPFNAQTLMPIYFQPQTLFFALLLKLGVPASWILITFTVICSVICFRLVIAIFDHLLERNRYRIFSIWLFAWGGGLLALAGIILHFLLNNGKSLVEDLFILDPGYGWWGLNLGRSLFFSCEAYYHVLFLGCVYCLLKRKWIGGSVLMLVLLLSHPFSGLELIGIVCFWIFIELLIDRTTLPRGFVLAVIFCLALYIYYYFFYLNQFADHRSVADQYSLKWRLGLYRALPAYGLVGLLAVIAIRRENFRRFFQTSSRRLFLCWFIIAFLLANHDLFMKGRQPIHFTRGYIWTSLFLLGLPTLQRLNISMKTRFHRLGLIFIALIFFVDNLTWISLNVASRAAHPDSRYINSEQEQVFTLLNNECTERTLLISNDGTISYLSTVYTKAYPWLSHPFTTPFVADKKISYRAFIERGQVDSLWLGRQVIFVLKRDKELEHILPVLNKMDIVMEKETTNYFIFKSDSLFLKRQ